MLPKILSIASLASFVLLSALLQVTSPSTIHPVGILLIYVLIYVLALGVLTLFLWNGTRVVGALTRKNGVKIGVEKAYYFASVLALTPVILIALRSIGRLEGYEIVLVVVFELIACFYVSKRY